MTAIPRPALAYGIILLSGLLVASVHAARPVTPTEHVRAVMQEALEVLEDEGLERAAKWDRVSEVLHRHFDFRSLAQAVLARHWHSASPAEQHAFARYFAEYLEAVYRDRIEAYSGQQIDYVDEQIRGDRAMVDIAIAGNEVWTPVTFRLRDRDGEWLAYDVVVDGVSLVANYRETFDAILAAEGLEGLTREVRGHVEAYRLRQESAEPSR